MMGEIESLICYICSLEWQLCLDYNSGQCERRISSSSFCGQLADYYSHVFSLINPSLLDEFSFKEMRTQSQINISSCCLYVWCKSRNRRQGESKICNTHDGNLLRRPSTSYKMLLGRVALGIIYIVPQQFYVLILHVF